MPGMRSLECKEHRALIDFPQYPQFIGTTTGPENMSFRIYPGIINRLLDVLRQSIIRRMAFDSAVSALRICPTGCII